MATTLPPVEDLVPHAAPMLALESVSRWEPGRATCHLTIRDDDLLVRDGAAPAVALIEYLGQAVAACCGAEAYAGGEGVRYGVIIGCRTVTLDCSELPVGTALRLEVTRSRGNEMLSHFQCEAFADGADDDGGRLAAAQMTVFHAEDMPE